MAKNRGEDEADEWMSRLKVELDWLKKNLAKSTPELRALVDVGHPEISIARQCELLGLARSSFYYRPAMESELSLRLMRHMDEIYNKWPFYGSRRLAHELTGCVSLELENPNFRSTASVCNACCE